MNIQNNTTTVKIETKTLVVPLELSRSSESQIPFIIGRLYKAAIHLQSAEPEQLLLAIDALLSAQRNILDEFHVEAQYEDFKSYDVYEKYEFPLVFQELYRLAFEFNRYLVATERCEQEYLIRQKQTIINNLYQEITFIFSEIEHLIANRYDNYFQSEKSIFSRVEYLTHDEYEAKCKKRDDLAETLYSELNNFVCTDSVEFRYNMQEYCDYCIKKYYESYPNNDEPHILDAFKIIHYSSDEVNELYHNRSLYHLEYQYIKVSELADSKIKSELRVFREANAEVLRQSYHELYPNNDYPELLEIFLSRQPDADHMYLYLIESNL